MLVIIFYELIVLFILGREPGTDNTKLSIHITKLFLGGDAEVKTLAVLDVIVDGRHECAVVKTTLQV